jgi:iron-sulfur cluster repair protein YtfE (RIC family)
MLNKKEFEQLKFFAQKVAEVHWSEHREYIDLNEIIQKIDLDDLSKTDFDSLKNLTNNYEIPAWACNAQTILLNLLAKLEK